MTLQKCNCARIQIISLFSVFLLLFVLMNTGCPGKTSDSGQPGTSSNGQTAPETTVVSIPDPDLEYAIRFRIEKPQGDILKSDLTDITVLRITDKTIANLEGIQYCVNLETLDLKSNKITDLTPLSSLTNLKELSVFNNLITDISPLSNLTNLVKLSVGQNQIIDITPLAGLTNLEDLGLYRNQIADISPLANLLKLKVIGLGSNQVADLTSLASLTELENLGLGDNLVVDITPLAGLTKMTTLSLSNNQIVDLQPLVDNIGLDTGDTVALKNNPLSDTALHIQIPALRSKGVEVSME